MTIDTTTSTVSYQGNGATTVFTFPFVADSATDIDVYYTNASGNQTLLSPSVYTLTINAVPVGGLWGIGGSVTYPISGTPIQAGTSISIVRSVPYTQDVSISNQGAFYPQVVEQGLDILEMQIQQIVNEKDRAIRVPIDDTTAQTILPEPVQRQAKLVGFDSTGENVQMYPSSAVPGPIAFLSQTVTHAMSPYTASNANLLFVDSSSGSVTIILPNANINKQYFITKVDSGNTVGNITIQAQAGQTIIGSNTFTNLQWQYQSNVFISDGGSNWDIQSQFRPQSATRVTNSFVSFTNILDVINNQAVINDILTRGGASRIDSYIAAAIALGGEIYFPSGEYHLQNTVTMAPGVIFRGAGQGNTVIFAGEGPTSTWGFELLLPNGTQQIEAPKFYDMTIQATGSANGIRWNSITGGFTDDNTSQQYMVRPRLVNVTMSNDSSTFGIGIQMNKCFDFLVTGCEFLGFNGPMDFEGSDIGSVYNNRTDFTQTFEITANSHGTFGSSLYVRENDFNNPAIANVNGGFIASTYHDITIENNHMELDGGVTRNNLLVFSGSDAFEIKIHNNRVDSNGNCVNWLNISPHVNRYLVSVFNNVTGSGPTVQGNVSFGSQPYFNNAGGRCIIRHGGNTNGDNSFPMNTDIVGWPSPTNASTAAIVNVNTPGWNYANSTYKPNCNTGLMIIPYNASPSVLVEISDWGSYGMIGNVLIGTLTITLQSAGGAAGLVGSYAVFDGVNAVSSGTITHTVANRMYSTVLASSVVFQHNAIVQLWNADGTRNERFYIAAAGFGIG